MQRALFSSSWDGINTPYESYDVLMTSALKTQLFVRANLTKYKIQTWKAGPLCRCLWPCCTAAGRLEGHLLQASQMIPQDNPVKRSLCSSGQACSLQSKCKFPLCYFCRRLLFSLMTTMQSLTVLCP